MKISFTCGMQTASHTQNSWKLIRTFPMSLRFSRVLDVACRASPLHNEEVLASGLNKVFMSSTLLGVACSAITCIRLWYLPQLQSEKFANARVRPK